MKKFTIVFAVISMLFITNNLYSQLVKTVVSVEGEVYDAITHKPLSLYVEVVNADGKRIQKVQSNLQDGSYFITGLTPGGNFEIRIAELDYMKQYFPLFLPNTDKYMEYSKDINLIPKKVGTKILIPVKLFEVGKSSLKYGSDLFLKDYVNLLKLNPTVSVKIVSFADENNSSKNPDLANQRSAAIKDFLIQNGIEDRRITTQGVLTTDPAFPPPIGKASKGKKYVGTNYLVIEGL
jgi:outer membrane protein OmpA-like peptidoglycan-associated protein